MKRPTGSALTWDLSLLLVGAFLLRLIVGRQIPNIHWPDEIFQVTEPAHRLVFGTGIVAWEWLAGIRSWLLPGLFAALMEVGRLFSRSDPAIINLPGAVTMAALGCLPVFCAYRWSFDQLDRIGAVIAGFATAVWSDLVYMSPHTLTEVIAADLLPLGLYLGYPLDLVSARSATRIVWSGVILGLTFSCRFHMAPALLVATAGICRTRTRDWYRLGLGALIPILGLGLLDWVTLGRPFQSVWLNFWYNVVDGVSHEYGRDPWWLLFALVPIIWAPAFPVVAITAYAGARRLPLLLAVSGTIFVTHALFAHKEYRFIYPAVPLLIVLAGLGTSDLLAQLGTRWPRLAPRSLCLMAGMLLWLGMSLGIAKRPFMNPAWTRDAGFLAAFQEISRLPQACGVATNHSITSPGNTWLRPGLPLYQFGFVKSSASRFALVAPAFNVIAVTSRVSIKDPRYRRLDCHDGDIDARGRVHRRICIWLRPGGCDPRAAPPPEPYWPDYFRSKMGLAPLDLAAITSEAGP